MKESFVLLLYFWTGLINALCIGALWKSTKISMYKYLIIIWCSGALGMLLIIFLGQYGHLLLLSSYLPFFGYHFFLALLMSKLTSQKFKIKKYTTIFIAGIITSLVFYYVGISSDSVIALPLFFSIGYPSVETGFKTLFLNRSDHSGMSVAMLGMGLVTFLNGALSLLFPLIYLNEFYLLIGFTVAFALAIALTLYGPGVILEKVMRDKIKLELEFKYKAKLNYKSRLAALGEMAGGVAHEINNPLAIMKFCIRESEFLLDQEENSDIAKKVASQLATVKGEVNKVAEIVKCLLYFSEDEENLPMQITEIDKILEQTIILFREKFTINGVELITDFNSAGVNIRCHPSQISQVLMNLVNNAFDATNNSKIKWVKIKSELLKNTVLISISDSGEGISERIVDRLFQPFLSTKDVGKGSGLGLSASQGIIHSHGGELRLLSTHDPTILGIELSQA